MTITKFTSDHAAIRIDLGFDYDVTAVERTVQELQHALTSDGFSIIQTGRRDTLEGVSMTIEAVRFVGKEDVAVEENP